MNINFKKVKILQCEKCLTNKELGIRAGLSMKTIRKISKEEGKFNARTIGLIARALEVGISEVMEDN